MKKRNDQSSKRKARRKGRTPLVAPTISPKMTMRASLHFEPVEFAGQQSVASGPSDVLDHATSEIASGSKLGIDATKKIPGEGFKRPWPPLIKMDAAVKAKVEKLFGDR